MDTGSLLELVSLVFVVLLGDLLLGLLVVNGVGTRYVLVSEGWFSRCGSRYLLVRKA